MNKLSVLLGIALVALPWGIPDSWINEEHIHSFFVGVFTLAGTLLGFVVSSVSILAAFSNNIIANNLKKTGHFSSLLNSFYWTGCGFFVSMVVGFISFFLDERYFWNLSVGVLAISFLGLFITGRRFKMVIKAVSKPQGNPNRLD